jgi:hypothetical protein
MCFFGKTLVGCSSFDVGFSHLLISHPRNDERKGDSFVYSNVVVDESVSVSKSYVVGDVRLEGTMNGNVMKGKVIFIDEASQLGSRRRNQ